MDAREVITLINTAAKNDLAINREMMDNHLQESQEVIANIGMLKALEGPDPVNATMAALEAALKNPQPQEVTP